MTGKPSGTLIKLKVTGTSFFFRIGRVTLASVMSLVVYSSCSSLPSASRNFRGRVVV